MYATQTNYSCVSCQSPCGYCTSLTVCITCLNGFYLSNSSCVVECPAGYTGVNQLCQVCLGNCATCSGSTTLCNSCKSNTYFMSANNSCVNSCGTGLYIDYLTQSCIACTSPCKTCTNTSDTCLSCTVGILYNN
jgi:proprotein convertase subtilisin/kexin type 5